MEGTGPKAPRVGWARAGCEPGWFVPTNLHIFYQPVVSLITGRTVAVEALVRLQDPNAGLLLPASFIPRAETSGFIAIIDEWVLDGACEQLSSWLARDEVPDDLVVSVNFSAPSLGRADAAQRVERSLARCSLNPAKIQLEITEGTIIQDVDLACRTIERLRAIGVRMALDDFGTGYSSLSYVKRFSIDVLKLDRQFVEPIEKGGRASIIVGATVALAGALGMGVVAEGVESGGQAEQLRRLGCEFAQGFLYGRPAPPAALAGRFSRPHALSRP